MIDSMSSLELAAFSVLFLFFFFFLSGAVYVLKGIKLINLSFKLFFSRRKG